MKNLNNLKRSRVTASSSAPTVSAQSGNPPESPDWIGPETPGQVLMDWMRDFGIADPDMKSIIFCRMVQDEAGDVRRTINAKGTIVLRDFAQNIANQIDNVMNAKFKSSSVDKMPLIDSVVKLWARCIWGRLVSPGLVAFKLFVDHLSVVILDKLIPTENISYELQLSAFASAEALDSPNSIFGDNPGSHLLGISASGASLDAFSEVKDLKARLATATANQKGEQSITEYTISVTEKSSIARGIFWKVEGLPIFFNKRYSILDPLEFYVRDCYSSIFKLLNDLILGNEMVVPGYEKDERDNRMGVPGNDEPGNEMGVPGNEVDESANEVGVPSSKVEAPFLQNILVTGVPGIGKSTFAIYSFLKRFIEERKMSQSFPISDFFFELKHEEYRRFELLDKQHEQLSEGCSRWTLKIRVTENVEPDMISGLIFSDILELCEPGQTGRWKCIFSSPDPKRYKETMKAHQNNNTRITMPTWSEMELRQLEPNESLWLPAWIRYGGVPRLILKYRGRELNALNTPLKEKGPEIMERFVRFGLRNKDDDTSYLLVHINPPTIYGTSHYGFMGEAVHGFASEWVAQELTTTYMNSIVARNAFEFDAGGARSQWGNSAGVRFEKILLWNLTIDKESFLFTCLEDGRSKVELTLSFPPFKTLPVGWEKTKSLEVNVFYRPVHGNLESADAFAAIPASDGTHWLVVVQITMAAEHGIKAQGLKVILSAFPNTVAFTRKIVGFMTDQHCSLNKRQTFRTLNDAVCKVEPPEVKDFEQFLHRISFTNRRGEKLVDKNPPRRRASF